MNGNLTRSRWSGYWFILPSAIMLIALIVYPLIYGAYISFFDTNLTNRWDFVGFKYYIEAFSTPEFIGKVYTTLKFTAIVVAGNMVIGTLLAVVLNTKIKGRGFFRAILIFPWLFPEVVVALLWKWLYDPMYGLFNHILLKLHLISEPISWLADPKVALIAVAIACIWKGYPLIMVLASAGLQSIPKELYEAAELDGSNKLQSFRHITLPGLKPVLLVALILETVWWFKHFTIIWLLTAGGPVDTTSVVSIDIYQRAFEDFQFGRAAAFSVLVLFVCLFISFIYRKVMADEQ
ncbi:sugar ABC transporter permease [Virgibacillus sp. NKC19-3]|uniref:carbohydrate ABC transporter permease n=1 Tax=Virgibacillus saliphilus TaxID=2831674 RepID=UPI001C9A99C8|nr:sugar ABC transporter permease [Virgibacillus sp. NKC19-3]MBY7144213.1 sugar ABC transporter permease [Virgibacillus sp. NKC19-3]